MIFSNSIVLKKLGMAIITLVFCLSSICVLNSCESKEEPVVEYKDKEFVEDVALGWQERFDSESQAAEEDDVEKQVEFLLKGCDAELSRIEKYENQEFKKQGLKDLMVEYIACLRDGDEALKYYVSDNEKYISSIQTVNNDRRRILTRMASDYGLAIDDAHKDAFSDWLSNAEVTGAYSKQQKTVEEFVANIKFEKEPDDYYDEKYHTYSTNLKNTTNIYFDKLDIKVKLHDAKDVVVGTESVYIENFKPGSTEKIEFSSDEKFEKMEVICDSWEEHK